jgi:hypothetical protein
LATPVGWLATPTLDVDGAALGSLPNLRALETLWHQDFGVTARALR